MADEINIQGDLSGGDARKKQLDDIRTAAEKAGQEINALSKEFKELSNLAGANKNIGVDTSKVKVLTKSMSEITVSTLKSSKERKKFATQLLAAEKEQAGTATVIENLSKEIKERKKEDLALEKVADILRKKSRDEQLEFEERISKHKAKATQLEIDADKMLQKAIASGKKDEIANAEKAHSSMMAKSKENYDLAKKLTADAKTKETAAQKLINKKQDLVKESQAETSALEGQKRSAEEINAAQEKQIGKAKELHGEMQKIEKAGGSVLKSFSEFGQKIGGMIPVFGQLFQTVFGELADAQKMFEDAVAQGTSKAGARYKALTGTIKALTIAAATSFAKMAFDGAKTSSEAFKIVKQGIGGGLIDAKIAMQAASGAAAKMGIPLAEASGYIGQMNSALGTSLGFTSEQVATFGRLTRNMGVSSGAATKIFKIATKTGISFEDMAKKVGGITTKLNAMNGTAIAPQAVFEEMGNASSTILRNMKDNPDALIKAAAGARAMGMEMNRIADAAESTLDFENSMQKEMEAELILGKELNLDKLRAAAATGDQVAIQEEQKRIIMENADAVKGNVKAQEMLAASLGMSKEELNGILNATEDNVKMANNDAAAAQANAENKKKSAEELGQLQLNTFKTLNSLSDKLNKFTEDLSLGAFKFFNLIRDAFDPKDIMGSLGRIKDLVIKTFKDAFTGGDTVFKNTLGKGSMLGMLLGAATMTGGALTIGFKGLSAIGGIFKKMRGTPMMPMFVKNIGDKTAGILSKFTSMFKNKKGGAAAAGGGGILSKLTSVFKKRGSGDLVKSASSPSGFRDKMGRFAKAPGKSAAGGGAAGGVGGMLKGIGKGIGDFAKGIGKGIKGILEGLAFGIKAFGSGQVLAGAAVLGAAITLIGAGIAGASWLMGKSLPTLAKGMESIAELDGSALIKAGAGMAAVGLGLTAMAAGTAAQAVGGLMGAIGSFFGGDGIDEMLKKVEKFGKNYDFDAGKIENNAKGVVAYALAMGALAVGAGAGAVAGLANLGSTLLDGLTASLGGGLPMDKVQAFGKWNLDADKIENNARAVAGYAVGMAALAGGAAGGGIASLANLGGALLDGLTSTLGGDLPMDKVQQFGKYNLDADKVENNARAIAGYARGMAALAGGSAASSLSSLAGLGGSLVDGIVAGIGGPLPLDKVSKFQTYNFDADKVKNNASALASYALGMAALAGGAAASSVASLAALSGSVVDGIVAGVGGPLPLDKVDKFQKYNFDPKKVKNNASAIASYAIGMAKLAGGSAASSVASLSSIAGNLADGLMAGLGGPLPLDKVKIFQGYDFKKDKIKNNSEAISEYAIAMAKLASSEAGGFLASLGKAAGQLVTGLAESIGLGGIPYDKLKELENADLDAEKIGNNAKALTAYALAMASLQDVPSGFFKSLGKMGSELVDGITDALGGTSGIPYEEMNAFANAKLETKKIISNAEALQAFGTAMTSLGTFDNDTDKFYDGIEDLGNGIDAFNKLEDIDTNKIESLRTSMLAIKDATSIDLSNAKSILEDLGSFAKTVGKGVIKVDIAAKTIFSEELEGLTSTIDSSSNRELEELKKINQEQSKEHRKEMKELRRQTFLLAEALGDRKDTVIQMDGFQVGKALGSRY
jgi:hypothetical protein